MTTTDTASRPHALYRFYDTHDRLLYIGITVSLPTRLTDHRDDKPWWRDVARMTVEHFADRESVLAAEKAAIVTERPLHNVHHNGHSTRTNATPTGRQATRVPAGIPAWKFCSLANGYPRTEPLWLYWEVHCDPISDDYTVDEIRPSDLWRLWLDDTIDEAAEAIHGHGAFQISWFVEGPSTFEGAPLRDIRCSMHHMHQHPETWPDEESMHKSMHDLNFLGHFTWPRDPTTGERLQWSRLPVIDKVWRERNLPELHAFKGGFIQEATGWKPSPLQPFVDVYQLGQMADLYVPGRGL